jgi:hypothetical protein
MIWSSDGNQGNIIICQVTMEGLKCGMDIQVWTVNEQFRLQIESTDNIWVADVQRAQSIPSDINNLIRINNLI